MEINKLPNVKKYWINDGYLNIELKDNHRLRMNFNNTETLKKQLTLTDVGCSKRLNLVVFEDYTRCYKVSDDELEQLKNDGDIEKGDIVCKVEVIKEY